MLRLLIQSRVTGRFMAPCPKTGQPEWVVCLDQAGAGILGDYESCAQIIEDHCDLIEDKPYVLDLDTLDS